METHGIKAALEESTMFLCGLPIAVLLMSKSKQLNKRLELAI